MAELKEYTSPNLDGSGCEGTLASLEAALKDMTPERWDWHLNEDDAERTALEAYWNKCENELIAFRVKNEENRVETVNGLELFNKYAPTKHKQDIAASAR